MVARAHPVDLHVGSRMRLRRTLLAMSQEKLGQILGLTFQQVQKYERGANRIGAGRLFKIAQALDVPVSFFFDDLPDDMKLKPSTPVAPVEDGGAGISDGLMSRRETLEFVRSYYRIKDPKVRRNVQEMVKAIAGPTPGAKRRGRPPGSTKKRKVAETVDA